MAKEIMKVLPWVIGGLAAGWIIHALYTNSPMYSVSPIRYGSEVGRAAPYLGWEPATQSW